MNPQSVQRRALRVIMPCLVAGSLLASAAQAVAASPSIEREWVSGVTPTDATLNAEIDPEGLDTEYQFGLYSQVVCPPPPPGMAQCYVLGGWVGPVLPTGSIPTGNGRVTVSLRLSDVGQQLRPETKYRYDVEATNADGTTQGLTYEFKTRPDGPPPDPPVNTVAPVLFGIPEPGETLTCGHGSWENEPEWYSFAWRLDGSIVAGEDLRELEVQPEDRGHEISCEVTAGNWGGSESALSNVLQVPELPSAPANVDPPVVNGSPQVGATLACSSGTWENDPTDYGYDWLRDGSVVASGDSDLVVSAADRGHVLACAVTASNEGGASQATSDGVAVPAETQQAPVEIQPGAALPAAALPVAPPVTEPIHRRKCPPSHHANRRHGARTGARSRAARGCHPRPRKTR